LISGNYLNWAKEVTIAKYKNELLHCVLLNDIFGIHEIDWQNTFDSRNLYNKFQCNEKDGL
jgi:hypothetical protein